MSYTKLTIVIPAFNEEPTVEKLLAQVRDVQLVNDLQKEIIVIDDASTDETAKCVERFITSNESVDIRLLRHDRNQGKGAALHTGFASASGDLLVIQDADLEYDPTEYNELLQPILRGNADVVYGSRFRGGKPVRNLFFWHSVGNKWLTFLSNMCNNLNLTDIETCYKMFKASVIRDLHFKEKRFGFEPEFTAKVARIPDICIYEIGIAYYGRTYQDGKKINWKDGVRTVYCILKYSIFHGHPRS